MQAESLKISEDQLKSKLYQAFRTSGIDDALKAQLRLHLAQIFKPNTGQSNKPQSLLIKAINSLFVQYLHAHGYNYTVSVFLPECGMSSTFTEEEIVAVLHLDKMPAFHRLKEKRSSTKDNPDTEDQSDLLWNILREVSQPPPATLDEGIQTDQPLETLDKKLAHIDEDYLFKSQGGASSQTLEERMIKYQREVDERGKAELEQAMARFRDVELSRLRMEESNRYRDAFAKEREDLERKVAEKLDRLRAREMELEDISRRKEAEYGKADYEQRQRIVRDMEVLKMREEEGRREREVSAKTLKIQKERMVEREEAINARLDEAHRMVDQMRAKCELDMATFKSDHLRAHEDERNTIHRDRARLDEDMKRFLMEKEPHSRMYERIKTLEEEAKVAQQRLQVSQEYTAAMSSKLEQLQREMHDTGARSFAGTRSGRADVASTLMLQDGTTVMNPLDEIERLRSVVQQRDEQCERLEQENARLAQACKQMHELHEMHEQEIQDMVEEHASIVQIAQDKAQLLEKEAIKERERFKEELKREVDTRISVQRRLDETTADLSRRDFTRSFVSSGYSSMQIPVQSIPIQPSMMQTNPMQIPVIEHPPFTPIAYQPQQIPASFASSKSILGGGSPLRLSRSRPVPPEREDVEGGGDDDGFKDIFQRLEDEDKRVQRKYYEYLQGVKDHAATPWKVAAERERVVDVKRAWERETEDEPPTKPAKKREPTEDKEDWVERELQRREKEMREKLRLEESQREKEPESRAEKPSTFFEEEEEERRIVEDQRRRKEGREERDRSDKLEAERQRKFAEERRKEREEEEERARKAEADRKQRLLEQEERERIEREREREREEREKKEREHREEEEEEEERRRKEAEAEIERERERERQRQQRLQEEKEEDERRQRREDEERRRRQREEDERIRRLEEDEERRRIEMEEEEQLAREREAARRRRQKEREEREQREREDQKRLAEEKERLERERLEEERSRKLMQALSLAQAKPAPSKQEPTLEDRKKQKEQELLEAIRLRKENERLTAIAQRLDKDESDGSDIDVDDLLEGELDTGLTDRSTGSEGKFVLSGDDLDFGDDDDVYSTERNE